jgi:hypothetical protein
VPVDFEKLKELFPETLAGLNQVEAKGENDEVEKVKITRASARYAGKDLNSSANLRIEVHVADHGADKSARTRGSFQLIVKMQVDHEDENGFLRSLKIQDQPALLRYRKDKKDGLLQIVVAERFEIVLTMSNLSPDEFRKIGEELKIKDLAALK